MNELLSKAKFVFGYDQSDNTGDGGRSVRPAANLPASIGSE